MWRLVESPDDISLYLCENNCVCLCAYEIWGVLKLARGGRGVVCSGSEGGFVYPLKISFSKQQAF